MPVSSTADLALGREIRRYRRAAGLTQQQVATQVGVTGAQFHRYETGASRLTASRLVGIAQVLGVPPDDLLAAAETAVRAHKVSLSDSSHDVAALLEMFTGIQDPQHRDVLVALVRTLSSSRQQSFNKELPVDAQMNISDLAPASQQLMRAA
jgi:transcriptional regulator with XRE-family HTH domain